MTAPDLLPCPFCGGKAERIELTDEDNKGGDVICCTKCQASSHVEFGRKENLVSAWNTRSTPLAEALAVPEVAALVQALRLLHDNVVLAFPALADLGPVANARAALKGADHE